MDVTNRDWQEWDGKTNRPPNDIIGKRCTVRYRSGVESVIEANSNYWGRNRNVPKSSEIVAYRNDQ